MSLILNLISKAEGTEKGGYNTVYGVNKTEPLTSMTLDEVVSWQRRYTTILNSPSSAAGKYQIIRKTLQGLIKEMDLNKSTLFNKEVQDSMALQLLNRRGFQEFLNGKLSVDNFMLRLAQEWASFPVPYDVKRRGRVIYKGQSYYAGDGLNKSGISVKEVATVLKKDKQNYNEPIIVLTIWQKIKLFFKRK